VKPQADELDIDNQSTGVRHRRLSTQSRHPSPESQRQQSHEKQTFYCRPVERILTHIGESSEAPPISPCRGPPTRDMFDRAVEFDPIHPEPKYEFDQTVSW
jgi:hypothetical protein